MKLNNLNKILIVVLVTALFGCNYNSNVMMKTGKNYPFDSPPTDSSGVYIISPSDIIEFKLYTNDGSLLVDFTAISGQSSPGSNNTSFEYLVEFDGLAKLPIIGRIELKGMSVKEVELLLEQKYAKYYVKPFVQLKVTNKRVTVFPGGSGSAKIVAITNDNMKLLEALGAVGGLTKLAKAKRIKLIRGDLKNPQVYIFDFSTMEGIMEADFVLQANDIIYVEPRSDYLQELVRDIAPIISLVASTLTLLVVINNINKL